MNDNSKQIVTPAQRVKTIKDIFATNTYKEAMHKLCPDLFKSQQCQQIYINLVNGRDDLAACSGMSLVGVLLKGVQLGLSFDTILGHAYPVPFKTKNGTIAQLIVGYRGLQKLARNSGEIKYFDGQVVYEGDEFSYSFGTDAHIHHVPSTSRDAVGSEANILGAWYMAKLTNGEIVFDFMPIRDILAIRERSIAYRAKSGPWITDFAAMCLKTVARRLAKKLPLSVVAENAVALDEMADRGVEQKNAEEFGFVDIEANGPSVVVPESEPMPDPESEGPQEQYGPDPEQSPPPPTDTRYSSQQRPPQRPAQPQRPPQPAPQTDSGGKEKIMIELLKFIDDNQVSGEQWDNICEQSRIEHNDVNRMDFAQLSAVLKNLKLIFRA